MFFLLLLKEDLCTFLLDEAHFGFEGLFLLVRSYLIGVRIASAVDICLEGSFSFGEVHFIEDGFQIVHLVFLRIVIAVCDFLDSIYNFFFCFIDFLLFVVVVRSVFRRRFGLGRGYILCHFYILLVESSHFLRVHHFTILVHE